ncbi:MAG TPA: RDD family protein [Sphingobacteriaceae bacterium]|nr:RDD family protein [Sphingobacteriaceae bacterium]
MAYLQLRLAVIDMSMIEQEFFVVINGQPSGPFSFQEVEGMKLKPSDFIKTPDSVDYRELQEIPELCDLLSITFEPTLPQYFATMDLRLLAWAIDFLVSFVIFCVFIFVPILLFSPEEDKFQLVFIGLLAIFPIHFFLSVFMESSKKQGSFGKNFLNIKVCDLRGLPISFGKSLIRNMLKLTGFLSLGLGFLMGFFDKKQQCWHDKLAKTFVVKDRLI